MRSRLSSLLGICLYLQVFHVAVLPAQTGEMVPPPVAPSPDTKVTDDRGLPLEGASVYIQQRPRFSIPAEVVNTTPTLTDSKGHFKITDEIPASSLFVFSKTGHATRAFPTSRPLPEEIRLPAGDKLIGVVTDDKGTSIPNVQVGPPTPQVGVSTINHRQLPLIFTHTDDDGEFTIDGVSRGRYDVLIQSPGYTTKLVPVIAGQYKRVVMETGGTTVTGIVRGSKDKLPQPNVYVEAGAPGIKLYAKTNAEGRYSFPYLRDQEWRFRVTADAMDISNPVQTIDIVQGTGHLELDLVMNQGIKVAGTFLNGETSEPLANLELRLDTDPHRTGTTDSNGHFEFENVGAFSDAVLRFDAVKYAYVNPEGQYREYVELPNTDGDDLTTLTILIYPRTTITGKVTDPFNQPVGNAVVTARPKSSEQQIGKSLAVREYTAKSDIDGQFRCIVFPSGPFEISASSEQMVSEVKSVEAYTTAPGQITLVVQPTMDLVGTVLDPNDQPVRNAQIIAYPENVESPAQKGQLPKATPLKRGNSDEKGAFVLPRIRAQKLRVFATHDSYLIPADATTNLDPAVSQPLVLKFPSGNDFSAIVTSANKPVGDAEVRLYFTQGANQEVVTRLSQFDGRVEIKGLPVSKIERLVVRTEKYVGYEKVDISLPQTDMAIELKERSSIDVTIVQPEKGAASSEPVSVVLLSATNDPAAPEPAANTYVSREQKGASGGKAKFENLDPGWYKVAAKQGNVYAESEAIQLTESGVKEVSVVLEAGGTLRGKVIDKETNKPVPNVAISVIPEAQGISEAEPTSTSSGNDGSFELAGVPAGDMLVSALHESYPEVVQTVRVPARGAVDVNIQLSSEMSKVSGRVSYAGQGLPNALLVLYKSGRNTNPVGTGTSDASGNYSIDNVPPGQYVLTVDAPVGNSEDLSHKSYELTISSAPATQDVVFERLTPVTGTVRLQGAEKISEGAILLFMAKRGGTTQNVPVKANGTFEAEIEPGLYSVGLEDRPGKDVEIPATDQPHRLQLSF